MISCIVYHGSRCEISAFESPHIPASARGNIAGIYFARDRTDAAEYGPFVYECRVSISNPYLGNPRELLRSYLGQWAPGFGAAAEAYRQDAELVNPSSIKEHLIQMGYDGVVLEAEASSAHCDEVIAFDPGQVEILGMLRIELDNECAEAELAPAPLDTWF